MGLLNLDATIKTAVAAALIPITGATTPIIAAPTTVSLGGSTTPQETVALERLNLHLEGLETRAQAIQALRTAADSWFGNSNYVMTELQVTKGMLMTPTSVGYWNVSAYFVLSRST